VSTTKDDHSAKFFALVAAAGVLAISTSIGLGVHHHAVVRDANALAALHGAIRTANGDRAEPSRLAYGVEASAAVALPEITVEEVTVATPTKVAANTPKKARARTSVWASIKGFFGKHA
jgi:hypothetical protein